MNKTAQGVSSQGYFHGQISDDTKFFPQLTPVVIEEIDRLVIYCRKELSLPNYIVQKNM